MRFPDKLGVFPGSFQEKKDEPEKTNFYDALSPAPAIVNALLDVIDVDFMELPVTPEKILKALE